MTDMDMSQYLGAFLDEADDNLQRLDDLLLALEKDTVNMDCPIPRRSRPLLRPWA